MKYRQELRQEWSVGTLFDLDKIHNDEEYTKWLEDELYKARQEIQKLNFDIESKT